jgi:hypothetical protein
MAQPSFGVLDFSLWCLGSLKSSVVYNKDLGWCIGYNPPSVVVAFG